MKYRIVEKWGRFYPQYKVGWFWMPIEYMGRHYCFYLGEAKQVIEAHKSKMEKPIIHNVD